MQYHLDTIPVWEAIEKEPDCLLCAIHQKIEADEVEHSLGGSVMEPDTRIQVNERGICREHNRQLYALQNRLGHALLIDSHTKEQLQKLEKLQKQASKLSGKKSLFGGKSDELDALIDGLKGLSSRCIICEHVEEHMKRYEYTVLHLWKSDAKFKQTFEASKGVCLPHAAELLEMAKTQLNGASRTEFAQALLDQLYARLSQDEKDLEWFTLKFDYRNHDKPWGNSKNALERTVNRLRERCLGDDAK